MINLHSMVDYLCTEYQLLPYVACIENNACFEILSRDIDMLVVALLHGLRWQYV